MAKKKKFERKYVLAEGYPWALGLGPYTDIQMRPIPCGGKPLEIAWPPELWTPELPKYRLVLERIQGE